MKSVIITIIFVTLTYGKTSGSRLTDNDLIINGNAIYLSGQLSYQNIEIINNGVLFLTEENGGKLELFCDSIIVDDGSSIVGNGIIQSGQGTPASGGGAGHGGNGGGTGCIGSGGPAYGLNLEFTINLQVVMWRQYYSWRWRRRNKNHSKLCRNQWEYLC